MWWIKLLVFLLIVASVVALFSGLSKMIKSQSADGGAVRALAWRVGLSLLAFLVLVVSKYFGWLEPHEVTNLRPSVPQEQQLTPVD